MSFTVTVNDDASGEILNTSIIIVDSEPGINTNQVTNPVAPEEPEESEEPGVPEEPEVPGTPEGPGVPIPASPSTPGLGLLRTGDALWIVPLLLLSVISGLALLGRGKMAQNKVDPS